MVRENVKDLVLERIASSIMLTALSYIKPGAPHRYSAHRWILSYSMMGLLMVNPILEACVRGEEVGRGEISARQARLAKIIVETYNVLLRKYKVLPPMPRVIPIFPILAISTSHTIVLRGRFEIPTFKNSVKTMLTACRGGELSELVGRLYRIGDSKVEEALRTNRIMESNVEPESITLLDVVEALSSIELSYKELINPRLTLRASKEILENYNLYGDLNAAIVRGYLELLESVGEVPAWAKRDIKRLLEEGNVGTKEGMKKLYELDKRFRDENLDYTYLLPLLNIATYMSLWGGLL